MTLQYEQPTINLQRASATTSFIFAPNASSADSSVSFSNFSTALEQARLTPGKKTILIDSGGATFVTIPPGTYDLTDVSLKGVGGLVPGDTRTAIAVDGVVFENYDTFENIVFSNTASTTTLFELDAGESLTCVNCNFVAAATSTTPMIATTGAGTSTLRFDRVSFIVATGGQAIASVAVGTTLDVQASNNTSFGEEGDEAVFDVAGTLNNNDRSVDTVFFESNQTVTGTVVQTPAESYEAAGAVGVVWAVSVPRSFEEAVNRIAAALAAGTTGVPIP